MPRSLAVVVLLAGIVGELLPGADARSEAIHFTYSQPREGGTEGTWRFDLDLTVD